MTPRTAKPLATFLTETGTETPVVARVRQHAHLQNRFVAALRAVGRGDLTAHTRVATLDGTTLVVAAANAACAAILKQLVPRVMQKISEDSRLETTDAAARKSENQMQEQEVTAIRVVLQPDPGAWKVATPPPPKPRLGRNPMDDSALAALAESLADSPLKDTLTKIQQKRKQALTNRKRGPAE